MRYSVLILGNSLHTNSRGVLEFQGHRLGDALREGKGKRGIIFHVICLWMGKGVSPYCLLKFGVGIKTQVTIDSKMLCSFHHDTAFSLFSGAYCSGNCMRYRECSWACKQQPGMLTLLGILLKNRFIELVQFLK